GFVCFASSKSSDPSRAEPTNSKSSRSRRLRPSATIAWSSAMSTLGFCILVLMSAVIPRARGQWHDTVHNSPFANFAGDRHGPTGHPTPVLHTSESDPVTADRWGIKTTAGVLDVQVDLIGHGIQRNPNVLRARVFDRVPQGLLRDPI